MRTNFKRFLSVFLLFLGIFSVLVMPNLALAQFSTPIASPTAPPIPPNPPSTQNRTWYNQSYQEWFNKVYDDSNPQEIFGERYTAAQVQWIFYSLQTLPLQIAMGGNMKPITCMLSNASDLSVCASAIEEITNNFRGLTQSSNDQNFLSLVGSLSIGNSVSGIGYIYDIIHKFQPIKTANAQTGFGFTRLTPIRDLWAATRNVSYGLLVLVIIVFAFMIMFRVKLNPQTVVTIQMAIPKIMFSVILITFSYAIAGFAIDIMYVSLGLLAILISGSGTSVHSALTLFTIFSSEANALGLLIVYWLGFIVSSLGVMFSQASLISFIGGFVMLVFSLISIIMLLYYSIKILISLFKNFALLMLTIIVGPLEILLGTLLPGLGFGSWLKRLISYLAVYPVMNFMFFLAFFFLAQAVPDWMGSGWSAFSTHGIKVNVISGRIWAPPLGGDWAPDKLLWLILSFVIITIIPKTTEIIQSFIAGQRFNYGSAIGEATGPIRGAGELGQKGAVYGGLNALVNRGGAIGAGANWLGKTLGLMKYIPWVP